MIGRYLNGKNTEEPIREKRESADDSYWLIQEVEGRRQGKNENGLIFFGKYMANLYFWLSVEAKSIQIMIGFSYKRLDFFTGL